MALAYLVSFIFLNSTKVFW